MNCWHEERVTPLTSAVLVGSVDLVKRVLNFKNIKINLCNFYKSHCHTALFFAQIRGRFDVFELLIGRNDTDVNVRDSNGLTLLMKAAVQGSKDFVEILLKRPDLDVNAEVMANGQTALMAGCVPEDPSIVRMLLQVDRLDVHHRKHDGWTAFMVCCYFGREQAVKEFLKRGVAEVNAQDGYNETALHLASRYNRTNVAALLLRSEGINPNLQDGVGHTPLIYAASHGREDIVSLLVEVVTVDVNIQELSGFTALHCAVISRSLSVVRLLLAREDTDLNPRSFIRGATPLHIAAMRGFSKIANVLARDPRSEVDAPSHERRLGALHYACSYRHIDVVKVLLNTGLANVNLRNAYGVTALHLAARKQFSHIVRLLLKGADIQAGIQDVQGDTALHYTAQSCSEQNAVIANLLLRSQLDININALDSLNNTALAYSVYFGCREAFLQILQHPHLNPNIPLGRTGYSALMLAMIRRRWAYMADLLSMNTVSVNLQNRLGVSALHLCATLYYHSDLCRRLLNRHGVDVNSVARSNGNTPLHDACLYGNVEFVRQLVRRPGIWACMPNKMGMIPMDYAVANNHSDIVRVLTGNTNCNSSTTSGQGKRERRVQCTMYTLAT